MGERILEKPEPEPKVTIVETDIEDGHPARPSRLARTRSRLGNFTLILRQSFIRHPKIEVSPWAKVVRRLFYFLTVAGIFGIIAYTIHHALVFSLIRRLSPLRQPKNGLTQIVATWVEPGAPDSPPSWLPDFSRDVRPKAIHSHNDYWRRVPLYEALSLGITGVEADCHLINGELYVGHTNSSLRPNRTFRSLYVDPLITILGNQNAQNGVADFVTMNGVWDADPDEGLILMTDLKTEGVSTLEAVQRQLEPLRQKGWLTHWNGTSIVPGPILHVGTGRTPFAAVLNSTFSNSTYRDVFFDAPLDALSDMYNISNSYYTSTSLNRMFENIPHSGLTKTQVTVVNAQIQKATSLGLVSRYWDIPAWPVGKRTKIWKQLEQAEVGMLNVDAIDVAARWNWKLCRVLGLSLC